VACWLASGIVFGFAALKPILIAEGVYHEFCDPTEVGDGDIIPCAEQDMRLNLFFITATVTGNVSSLLGGILLDRFGRRTCWVASAVCLAVASFLLGLSFSIPGFDMYIVGNMLLALGGTLLFVSSFQLANTFPKHSGAIIALVTGAFDASAAVFLVYRLLYNATSGRFSPRWFFFGYLAVPALILITEFAYMDPLPYQTLPELERQIERAKDSNRDLHESDDEITSPNELERVRSARADRRMSELDQIEDVAGDKEYRLERVKTEEERQETSQVWGVLHGASASTQIRSPWFLLILLQTIVQMQRMNYFIATIRAQYRFLLDSEDEATAINHFFDVALPIGGVAATPFIGLLLNHVSVPTMSGILTCFIVAISVLNCLPSVAGGYATVLLFVIFRPLYYSAISYVSRAQRLLTAQLTGMFRDYAVKVFGFAAFGRIYGTLVCVSGVVNFSQSGMDALTHGPLHGDPTPINIAFGVAGGLIGVALTGFVTIQGRRFVARKKIGTSAAEDRRRLLSGGRDGYGT
jgi:MFS family permease